MSQAKLADSDRDRLGFAASVSPRPSTSKLQKSGALETFGDRRIVLFSQLHSTALLLHHHHHHLFLRASSSALFPSLP